MRLQIIDKIIFMGLVAFALGTAYIRISSTLMGYDIGEMKNQESLLLQERSRLNMELAKLTSKRNLSILAARNKKPEPTEILAAY